VPSPAVVPYLRQHPGEHMKISNIIEKH